MSFRPPPSVPRTDFGPAPPGYIPGLGRGAVGFTTRSDIGPARPMVEELTGGRGRSLPVPALPPGFGGSGVATVAQQPTEQSKAKREEEEEIAKYSDSNFDEFSGYTNEMLFASGEYDGDDREADMIYDAIDRRMDSKRKRRREELIKQENEAMANKRPSIQKQFLDLKRDLASISESEWECIPDALDYSHQNKLHKSINPREKFTPLPDNIAVPLAVAAPAATTSATPIDPFSALNTPIGTMSVAPDLTSIGRARDKMLGMKLDRMADSVSGQTVVDPKGYLTSMKEVKVSSDAEVSDIKKARLLLRSVIQTNPKHAPGWIAAARLEQETGKISAARQIIMKGCEINPTNEDVWMEAAAMQTKQNAKAILAKAVTHIPTSVNIWLMAANLEDDIDHKKAVLRRALEHLPTSVRLWKVAVEMEEPDDARIMLSRAVELIPESVELWLALARLESYEQARIVLNRARKAIPTDASIWITAAKLEEAHGNVQNVDLIIQKAVKSLSKYQVVIDRDAWFHEAELAEQCSSLETCNSIVRHTIGLGVEPLDRKNTWLNDAQTYINKQSFGVARSIYNHVLIVFPTKTSVWLKAVQLERQHGTKESLDAMLERSVQHCPQAEILWLMRAKEKWLANDVDGARAILTNAFAANPNSEEIWLAATKLEFENGEFERARLLLSKARDRAGTARVYMKSAKLERILHDDKRELELLEEGLKKFENYPKLYMMMGQLLERQGKYEAARDIYKRGIKHVGTESVDLWLVYAQFELDVGKRAYAAAQSSAAATSSAAQCPPPVINPYSKARSILETARLKMPNQPKLWVMAIRIELQADNKKVAEQLLAKALQDCPTSGLLWSLAISMDDRPKRKGRSYEALKRCTDDVHVFVAVAKLFWLDRKISKARQWFQRAVTVDPDLGDAWLYYYQFEIQHGTEQQQQELVKKCVEADPSHGELWCSLSKCDRYSKLKCGDILKLGADLKCVKDIFEVQGPQTFATLVKNEHNIKSDNSLIKQENAMKTE